MAVKELPPFVWRTFAQARVALSEEGAVATQIAEEEDFFFVDDYGSGADQGQALLGSGAAVRGR
jgi:hypothetical protein